MGELVEGKHNSFLLLGLSSTPAVYSGSPETHKPVVNAVECVSDSLYDTYILLEEWGLWTAALSVVQGVGTVRERSVFFIDDDTALSIDSNLARCKKRDPEGARNFEILESIYVRRLSYRKVSRVLGINAALIKGIVDKYVFCLDAKIYEGDGDHKKNVRRILALREKKACSV